MNEVTPARNAREYAPGEDYHYEQEHPQQQQQGWEEVEVEGVAAVPTPPPPPSQSVGVSPCRVVAGSYLPRSRNRTPSGAQLRAHSRHRVLYSTFTSPPREEDGRRRSSGGGVKMMMTSNRRMRKKEGSDAGARLSRGSGLIFSAAFSSSSSFSLISSLNGCGGATPSCGFSFQEGTTGYYPLPPSPPAGFAERRKNAFTEAAGVRKKEGEILMADFLPFSSPPESPGRLSSSSSRRSLPLSAETEALVHPMGFRFFSEEYPIRFLADGSCVRRQSKSRYLTYFTGAASEPTSRTTPTTSITSTNMSSSSFFTTESPFSRGERREVRGNIMKTPPLYASHSPPRRRQQRPHLAPPSSLLFLSSALNHEIKSDNNCTPTKNNNSSRREGGNEEEGKGIVVEGEDSTQEEWEARLQQHSSRRRRLGVELPRPLAPPTGYDFHSHSHPHRTPLPPSSRASVQRRGAGTPADRNSPFPSRFTTATNITSTTTNHNHDYPATSDCGGGQARRPVISSSRLETNKKSKNEKTCAAAAATPPLARGGGSKDEEKRKTKRRPRLGKPTPPTVLPLGTTSRAPHVLGGHSSASTEPVSEPREGGGRENHHNSSSGGRERAGRKGGMGCPHKGAVHRQHHPLNATSPPSLLYPTSVSLRDVMDSPDIVIAQEKTGRVPSLVPPSPSSRLPLPSSSHRTPDEGRSGVSRSSRNPRTSHDSTVRARTSRHPHHPSTKERSSRACMPHVPSPLPHPDHYRRSSSSFSSSSSSSGSCSSLLCSPAAAAAMHSSSSSLSSSSSSSSSVWAVGFPPSSSLFIFSEDAFRQLRHQLYTFLCRGGAHVDTALAAYRRSRYLSVEVVECALECAATTASFLDKLQSWQHRMLQLWSRCARPAAGVLGDGGPAAPFSPGEGRNMFAVPMPSIIATSSSSIAEWHGDGVKHISPDGCGSPPPVPSFQSRNSTKDNDKSTSRDDGEDGCSRSTKHSAHPERRGHQKTINDEEQQEQKGEKEEAIAGGVGRGGQKEIQRRRVLEMLSVFHEDCMLLHRKAQFLVECWDYPEFSSSSALLLPTTATSPPPPRRHLRSSSLFPTSIWTPCQVRQHSSWYCGRTIFISPSSDFCPRAPHSLHQKGQRFTEAATGFRVGRL